MTLADSSWYLEVISVSSCDENAVGGPATDASKPVLAENQPDESERKEEEKVLPRDRDEEEQGMPQPGEQSMCWLFVWQLQLTAFVWAEAADQTSDSGLGTTASQADSHARPSEESDEERTQNVSLEENVEEEQEKEEEEEAEEEYDEQAFFDDFFPDHQIFLDGELASYTPYMKYTLAPPEQGIPESEWLEMMHAALDEEAAHLQALLGHLRRHANTALSEMMLCEVEVVQTQKLLGRLEDGIRARAGEAFFAHYQRLVTDGTGDASEESEVGSYHSEVEPKMWEGSDSDDSEAYVPSNH
jgi:hypothetical protein